MVSQYSDQCYPRFQRDGDRLKYQECEKISNFVMDDSKSE